MGGGTTFVNSSMLMRKMQQQDSPCAEWSTGGIKEGLVRL